MLSFFANAVINSLLKKYITFICYTSIIFWKFLKYNNEWCVKKKIEKVLAALGVVVQILEIS